MKVFPITFCSPRNPVATKQFDPCVEPANRQICVANLTAVILQHFVANALGKKDKKNSECRGCWSWCVISHNRKNVK